MKIKSSFEPCISSLWEEQLSERYERIYQAVRTGNTKEENDEKEKLESLYKILKRWYSDAAIQNSTRRVLNEMWGKGHRLQFQIV